MEKTVTTKSIILLWFGFAYTVGVAILLWVMPVDRWSTFLATLGLISYELDRFGRFYEKP